MPIDKLDIWLDKFAALPQDPTGDLAPRNIAEFVDQRVSSKLETNTNMVQWTPAPTFTWQKSIFESTLKILCKIPSPLAIIPATSLATSWQTATLASSFAIQPQAKMNKPLPATNGIAATAVAVIDPPSVALAYAYLLPQLIAVPATSDPKEAVFPKAVRQAFLMLTYTITGVDTTPTPAGPIPFLFPLTGVS